MNPRDRHAAGPKARPIPDPTPAHRAIREAACIAYADLAPLIGRLRREDVSYSMIADWLNKAGRRTRRGCTFDAQTIRRIHLRAAIPADTRNQPAPM